MKRFQRIKLLPFYFILLDFLHNSENVIASGAKQSLPFLLRLLRRP